jgi:hypothetical protein
MLPIRILKIKLLSQSGNILFISSGALEEWMEHDLKANVQPQEVERQLTYCKTIVRWEHGDYSM